MTTIAEQLKTFVTASTSINATISGRMHYNVSPQDSSRPHVWYQRQASEDYLTLDQNIGLRSTRFDVECNSTSLSEAVSLSEKVRDRLSGYRGSFGTTSVQGVFVEDVDDSYLPKSNDGDEGITTSALSVVIWHTT